MKNALTWDLTQLKRIAGVPLKESVDDPDEDDMTPAEKALADKAEADLKKGNVKVKHINPDKDMARLAKKDKAKEVKAEEDSDTAEKAEASSAPKEEEPATEEKAAPKAREWIKSNPGHTGPTFKKWAVENGVMGKHYANTWYHGVGKKLTEGWILMHPQLKGFILAENREMNQNQWVDDNSPLEPLIFATESEAKEVANYMAEWKCQQCIIEHVVFEADEGDEKEEPRDKDSLKKVGVAKEWLKKNPLASREKFTDYAKETHGWAKVSSNSMYDALKAK